MLKFRTMVYRPGLRCRNSKPYFAFNNINPPPAIVANPAEIYEPGSAYEATGFKITYWKSQEPKHNANHICRKVIKAEPPLYIGR